MLGSHKPLHSIGFHNTAYDRQSHFRHMTQLLNCYGEAVGLDTFFFSITA